MNDKFDNLLAACSEMNFGAVDLSNGQKAFCTDLNDEIFSLCRSMPESTQTDALLFFMQYLRTSLGKELNFLKYFYAPAWSIIYWLVQPGATPQELELIDIGNAKTAHTMAMLLHALDDHLCDGEIPVTHLALLLRSQSWMVMYEAFNRLGEAVNGGNKIIQEFINDYYSSIRSSQEINSLDAYCELFRKQMATWLIVPVLMSEKMSPGDEFGEAIRSAFGSFGIAWRLLDDLKDIEIDMVKGVHSAVYVCLSKESKKAWGRDAVEKADENSDYRKIIFDAVLENDIIGKIKKRICSELDSAAGAADRFNLTGLANEYRSLVRPLRVQQNLL